MADEPNVKQMVPVEIEAEMKKSYLDYAMSVIVARAIPDVRAGLKPVQRRILVAMNDLGLASNRGYRKCAKICGDTSGNYHPHGEAVIYPTLVRLAQPFNMRYMLIDGQGNYGSVDGDPPAAMRYTEARLAKITEEILADLEKETVDFVPNFDQTRATMQIANLVHATIAVLFIAASFFHIYLGSLGQAGAYEAMRDGVVDETWAKEHHELWYNDVKAGKVPLHDKQPHVTPPRTAS